MSDNYSYAKVTFGEAVDILTVSKEEIRTRLIEAYQIFWTLTPHDFPEFLRDDWIWIKNQMKKYGPKDWGYAPLNETAIQHTMRRIRKSTGQKIARRIVEVYNALDY